MSDNKSNNTPQTVQSKGIFASFRGATNGVEELTSTITEMAPLAKETAEQVNKTATEVANLGAKIGGAIGELQPEVVSSSKAIQQTAENIQKLGSKASRVLDKADSMMTNAGAVFEQLKIAMTPVQIIICGKNIVPALIKCARVIANFWMAGDGYKAASLIFNVISEFGSDIGRVIRNLLFTEEMVPFGRMQGTEDAAFIGSITEWLNENRTITVTGFAAALACIFQCTLGLPNNMSDTATLIKFFGDRCRGLKSILDFAKSSWKVFTDIADWILMQIFPGYNSPHDLDQYISGYGKWAREIVSLHSAEKPFYERVKKEKKLIFTVERLYRQGLVFSRAMGRLKTEDGTREHYQKHFKLISDFQKIADFSGVLGNKPRPKPLTVHLWGESGVGKSGATWPLAADFNAFVADRYEDSEDISAEVYFRNVEQEFWDGYCGQNVCVYDDHGQRTDTSANPNEEYMEIIRACNPAPYPLHMASLEEKARTKFISKFIILTSNVREQKVSSLTFPSAYRRRIDVSAKVTLRPEFTKKGTNADTGAEVLRLDTSKCDGPIDTRPYIFELYDPESGNVLSDDNGPIQMSYEFFLSLCLGKAFDNFDQSLSFNDALKTRMTKERFDKIKGMARGAYQASEKVVSFNSDYESDSDEEYEPEPETVTEVVQEQVVKAWEECKSSKLTKRVAGAMKTCFSSIFSIKGALVLVGVLLTGVTAWRVKNIVSSYNELNKPGPKKVRHDGVNFYITSEAANFANARSKAVSRLLRHQLQSIDGFHQISTVLEHLRVLKMTEEELREIVAKDTKKRFLIVGDRIRANQGHSYDINPELIYTPSTCGMATHFTHLRCVESIAQEGILSMNRSWVHLYPGVHTKLPSGFSGRNAYVHVDLSKCPGNVWDTANGYVHVLSVPPEAILSIGSLVTGKSEAATSGDDKTQRLRKLVTESLPDYKPPALEASSSNDALTKQVKKIATEVAEVEASASGDSRTRTMPRIITEIKGETQAWEDRTAQELISYRIMNNMYRIEIDGIQRLNGLFIRDTVMLTCQHLERYMEGKKEIRIFNMWGSEFKFPLDVLKKVILTTRDGGDKDAMLLQFPRYVNGHTDLVKHFQKMPELASRRANVCLPTIRSIRGQNVLYVLGNTAGTVKTSKFWEELNGEKHIREYRDSLQYKLNTTAGDCGAPVIVNDNSCLRKIAGIHSAALMDGSAICIGQSVTQADLERGLDAFTKQPIVVDCDELPNVAIPEGTVQLNKEYTKEDLIASFAMPGETFGLYGECTKVLTPPGQTDLRRSKMYGYVEPTTKPAFLYHKEQDLVHLNVAKNAMNTPYIPEEEVNRAVSEVKSLLISGESRKHLAKVYSLEEAIEGSPDSEYVTSVKRQTSPGYPWILDRVSGTPGKTTWLGADEQRFVADELREEVEHRIALARKGIRCPTVWTDTLKDERRPIEKVNALKTRVFAHGPMDYTIAVRQYFIGFVAHVMENRIDNEQSLGTNPFGADWGRTAQRLSRHGKKVFAGDFSQFDGTLNSCILSKFAEVANAFYNDGPENALIREVLLLDVYNSVHLCKNRFIQLTHSQPSGNPLTTVLNSFYNSVSMRIAYGRCFESKPPPFMDHVSMVSYGDDNVINLSETVAETFNQRSVTEAYASFGMIYTDETKSGGEVAPWRSLTEVQYLKRTFRKENGVWMAPLAMDTILECCNWVRKSPDEVEALKQNVEGACRELAQYPVEVFEEKTKLIADAFYGATSEFPVIKTRLEYLEDESPMF